MKLQQCRNFDHLLMQKMIISNSITAKNTSVDVYCNLNDSTENKSLVECKKSKKHLITNELPI
jgi:hypothetical protein